MARHSMSLNTLEKLYLRPWDREPRVPVPEVMRVRALRAIELVIELSG